MDKIILSKVKDMLRPALEEMDKWMFRVWCPLCEGVQPGGMHIDVEEGEGPCDCGESIGGPTATVTVYCGLCHNEVYKKTQ